MNARNVNFVDNRCGDIWSVDAPPGSYIAVPTSLAFDKRGDAIMGRGLAREASTKEPDVKGAYGRYLRSAVSTKAGVLSISNAAHCMRFVGARHNLLLMAAKPFNADAPHLSWQSDADLTTISVSLTQMLALLASVERMHVRLPLLGTGLGQLDANSVIDLYNEHFTAVVPSILQRITVVHQPHGNCYTSA